jgi:hypothetical protein
MVQRLHSIRIRFLPGQDLGEIECVGARLDLTDEKSPDKFRTGRPEKQLVLLAGLNRLTRILFDLGQGVSVELKG